MSDWYWEVLSIDLLTLALSGDQYKYLYDPASGNFHAWATDANGGPHHDEVAGDQMGDYMRGYAEPGFENPEIMTHQTLRFGPIDEHMHKAHELAQQYFTNEGWKVNPPKEYPGKYQSILSSEES